MTTQQPNSTSDIERVFQAIRDSWSAETCGTPAGWSRDNPAWQQCDASAFVAWEHLGGELVLGKVFRNGEQVEHHYWNRIDGTDVDLTRSQFTDGQEIIEHDVLTSSFLENNANSMKPDVLRRIAILRDEVNDRLTS